MEMAGNQRSPMKTASRHSARCAPLTQAEIHGRIVGHPGKNAAAMRISRHERRSRRGKSRRDGGSSKPDRARFSGETRHRSVPELMWSHSGTAGLRKSRIVKKAADAGKGETRAAAMQSFILDLRALRRNRFFLDLFSFTHDRRTA